MGINSKSLNIILEVLDKFTGRNCRMVELGDQYIKDKKGKKIDIAKYFFESIGVNHTSIDVNGRYGALPIDLTKVIANKELIKAFDVLTNFGTTEHVEEQYICWLNIHNLVRQGGIFIHCVPLTGSWKGHGQYKYNLKFFDSLSNECNYSTIREYIRYRKGQNFIVCISRKERDNEFMPIEFFNPLILKR